MMEHDPTTVTEKVAQNQLLLALARVSMVAALPLISAFAYFGSNYLESKFAAAHQQMQVNQDTLTTRIDTVEKAAIAKAENIEKVTVARIETAERNNSRQSDLTQKLSDKLIEIETKQKEDAIQRERFEAAVLQRLDRLQDSQVVMSNAISTLTATLQSMIESRGSTRFPQKN